MEKTTDPAAEAVSAKAMDAKENAKTLHMEEAVGAKSSQAGPEADADESVMRATPITEQEPLPTAGADASGSDITKPMAHTGTIATRIDNIMEEAGMGTMAMLLSRTRSQALKEAAQGFMRQWKDGMIPAAVVVQVLMNGAAMMQEKSEN